ncbi:hypothetical protein JG688_00005035 [Phytophthora aleatoria]|uniref:Uncharacterized protein n=1 Tax=Phytophthora aleatoria TaxID=2496075 RepID=A0A8J5J1C9_9STRA|nr:hypothetical protein JG688_00005035 [Phytophthora aleatoria]
MATKIPWVSEKAKFVRETSKFRNWIEPDPGAEFSADVSMGLQDIDHTLYERPAGHYRRVRCTPALFNRYV